MDRSIEREERVGGGGKGVKERRGREEGGGEGGKGLAIYKFRSNNIYIV